MIGSETIRRLLVPVFQGPDPEKIRMRDRMALYTFGDGAGAMLLQAGEEASHPDGAYRGRKANGIEYRLRHRLRRRRQKPGMQIVGAGTHTPIHRQLKAPRLVGLKVSILKSARFTPYVLTEALADLVRRSGVAAEAIDLCIIPEGNAGYMTDELKAAGLLTPEWVALEGRIFENLALVGATGSAALPLAVDYASNRAPPDRRHGDAAGD